MESACGCTRSARRSCGSRWPGLAMKALDSSSHSVRFSDAGRSVMTRHCALRSTVATLGGALAAAIAAAVFASAATPKFYADDPVWAEHDTQNVAGIPDLEVDDFVDLTLNLFGTLGDPTPNVRAKNVNTVDEVPNSAWFTNRIGRRPLTPGDVERGPDTGGGPADGNWTVTSSKSDGVTPGFTIRDATGQL